LVDPQIVAGSTRRSEPRMRFPAVLAGALGLVASLSLWIPNSVDAAAGGTHRYLDPVFSDARVNIDVTYGRVQETGEALKLDLYRPVGDSAPSRPVLIFLHGGGNNGDKGHLRNARIAEAFALRGWVAASINFREGGTDHDWTDDMQASVRWFKANAARFRIDPERVVVMGSSGGAITALHTNFNPEDPGTSGHPGYSSVVAGAISVGGTVLELEHRAG
jgi:acetyl esterase/lipase